MNKENEQKCSQHRIIEKVKVAKSFKDRLIGLMFAKSLGEYNGLLISPCRSIHTFFMRMSIDVIFLDKNYKIIKIIRRMKPWRVTGIYFRAAMSKR